ncbi:SPRY domain-containing protein 7 [Athene cunicularia]|uniref:SPRY domain-containing protein 7 n=1 Tax=Athene cunicularia TaxID=194338 RepID=UPI000EF70D01|nr:SPRY domain-containing protein 7 [Athene cunicularia]
MEQEGPRVCLGRPSGHRTRKLWLEVVRLRRPFVIRNLYAVLLLVLSQRILFLTFPPAAFTQAGLPSQLDSMGTVSTRTSIFENLFQRAHTFGHFIHCLPESGSRRFVFPISKTSRKPRYQRPVKLSLRVKHQGKEFWWVFFLLAGTDVVIVKNGRRICGTGGCLANAPLHQNKSYFEFKIQSTGIWGIGVATQKANLNQIPLGRDVHSLVMRNDGALYYNNEEKNRLPANNLPQEGDVVGITYDHVELNVYLNGKNMHCPASGIRGTVYPVVYVDDSAILDCQFSEFYHTPPPGFEKILFEQQIF